VLRLLCNAAQQSTTDLSVAEGYRVERLDRPGLLIGLQLERNYGCQQVVHRTGDVYPLFTMGRREAPALGGERFR